MGVPHSASCSRSGLVFGQTPISDRSSHHEVVRLSSQQSGRGYGVVKIVVMVSEFVVNEQVACPAVF